MKKLLLPILAILLAGCVENSPTKTTTGSTPMGMDTSSRMVDSAMMMNDTIRKK